jgi:hypothetical protein
LSSFSGVFIFFVSVFLRLPGVVLSQLLAPAAAAYKPSPGASIEDEQKASVENYVKTPAAKVDLPASIVKSAVELLERNRRLDWRKPAGYGV